MQNKIQRFLRANAPQTTTPHAKVTAFVAYVDRCDGLKSIRVVLQVGEGAFCNKDENDDDT